jgi:predicted HTH domain antitoxin
MSLSNLSNVVYKRAVDISERRIFRPTRLILLRHHAIQPHNMESDSKERKLLLAIQSIQENKNLSVTHAARIHTMPESTLRAEMKGRPSRRDIIPATGGVSKVIH